MITCLRIMFLKSSLTLLARATSGWVSFTVPHLYRSWFNRSSILDIPVVIFVTVGKFRLWTLIQFHAYIVHIIQHHHLSLKENWRCQLSPLFAEFKWNISPSNRWNTFTTTAISTARQYSCRYDLEYPLKTATLYTHWWGMQRGWLCT